MIQYLYSVFSCGSDQLTSTCLASKLTLVSSELNSTHKPHGLRVYSLCSHRGELCGKTHLLWQCPVYRPSIWEALSRMPRLLHGTWKRSCLFSLALLSDCRCFCEAVLPWLFSAFVLVLPFPLPRESPQTLMTSRWWKSPVSYFLEESAFVGLISGCFVVLALEYG